MEYAIRHVKSRKFIHINTVAKKILVFHLPAKGCIHFQRQSPQRTGASPTKPTELKNKNNAGMHATTAHHDDRRSHAPAYSEQTN